MQIAYKQEPVLSRAQYTNVELQGITGERLAVCLQHWWLVAPDANPAMLQIFRDRDRQPRRDLLPWSGEFAGKFLTSAVQGWRIMRDERLYAMIARTVDELISVQAADGYLGPFPHDIRLTGRYHGLQDGKEHELWDLWGHYHCMLGLLLWYADTSDTRALESCCNIANLLCNLFLDGGASILDAGAEEMNMAVAHGLCLLYEQTQNPRYLALAHKIEAEWQIPPAGDYIRQALAGVPFYRMPKPRWESLHDIQAIAELYFLTADPQYRTAFESIWQSILAGDRHNTGGFSSGEQATGDPYNPEPIETCCTVAWMATSIDMLRMRGDPLVADELELSLFNAMLGGQSPSGRWWTYNTPMDGVKKASAHDIVFQARAGSPELNCCSVNGPRGLAMLSDWALMKSATGPVINYYGPGSSTIPLEDSWSSAEQRELRISQETKYPVGDTILIRLGLSQETFFDLQLRIPQWSQHTLLRINGVALDESINPIAPGSYLHLNRSWRDGDSIELTLDMSLHYWFGQGVFADKVSIYRGPLLLAYDQRYNSFDPHEIPALDLATPSYTTAQWQGPLPPWLLLHFTTAEGRPLLLCDYANAGMAGTEFRSWLPYTHNSRQMAYDLPDKLSSVPANPITAD